jgi:hypothetical protein
LHEDPAADTGGELDGVRAGAVVDVDVDERPVQPDSVVVPAGHLDLYGGQFVEQVVVELVTDDGLVAEEGAQAHHDLQLDVHRSDLGHQRPPAWAARSSTWCAGTRSVPYSTQRA